MTSRFRFHRSVPPRISSRRAAFTLIEVMVALVVFSVLLGIIFVPLTQGVRFTQIGTARADMQQVGQTTMNRIVRELRTAAVVFPNERMAGVTTTNGYENNVKTGEVIGYPYYQGTGDVCTTTGRNAALVPAENTSRLDFIPSDRTATGGKAPYITTLYVARGNDNPNTPYDDYDNPLVLFRSTLPYNETDAVTNYAINLGNGGASKRYPAGLPTGDPDCTTDAAAINRGTQWLKQSDEGEVGPLNNKLASARVGLFGLVERSPSYDDPASLASHSRVTPLGSALYAPRANAAPGVVADRFASETSFICEDTNGNGIIDRVTVTLVLGKFDGAGAQSRAQTVRFTQAVDLPNTESRFNVPSP